MTNFTGEERVETPGYLLAYVHLCVPLAVQVYLLLNGRLL